KLRPRRYLMIINANNRITSLYICLGCSSACVGLPDYRCRLLCTHQTDNSVYNNCQQQISYRPCNSDRGALTNWFSIKGGINFRLRCIRWWFITHHDITTQGLGREGPLATSLIRVLG